MHYLAFTANIEFEAPESRVDGTVLHPHELSHYVMEWSTSVSYDEREILNQGEQQFVIEFTAEDYNQNEVPVEFSLRAVDENGLESDSVFYTLTLNPSDFSVGTTANVPIGDGIIIVLFIIFVGITHRTLH